jgi:hypothetical protein
VSWIALVVALAAGIDGAAIQGHVTDRAGRPVGGALVAAESAESEQVITTRTQPDGAFRLNNLAPGLTGVVAYADGHAFGGFSTTLAPGQTLANQQIALADPAPITGRISGYKDKAAEGARIVRVALLGAQKVSIPLDKLQQFGLDLPVSEKKGRFRVDHLPAGVPLALKITHTDYPTQAVTGMTAGDTNVKAVLMPGVLVTGNAIIRGEDRTVARVDIKLTNAQPPYESTTVRSDHAGQYAVRLKPGVYTVEGKSQAYRTPGLQRVTVSGERSEERINVFLMPTGTIVGDVRNAATDGPIAGARIMLESAGNPAGVAYTDSAGRYRFDGASGVNKIYFADAPGHVPSQTRSMQVSIAGGETYEMPVFWVLPASMLTLRIVDAAQTPVPGAAIGLLNPTTLGWLVADPQGRVSLPINTLPDDRMIAGIAEHPRVPACALFAVPYDSRDEHAAQLDAFAAVQGRVVDPAGRGVAGMIVAGRLLDQQDRPSLILWQTLSRHDGRFEWRGVMPHVRQRCEVYADTDQPAAVGQAFTSEPAGAADAGPLEVTTAAATSAHGNPLPWYDLKPAAGAAPVQRRTPAVVVYAPAPESALAFEALIEAQHVLNEFGVAVALVVEDLAPLAAHNHPALPVFEGTAPARATTYLTDADGYVVLETFGMPPLFALQQLRARSAPHE